jgi:organic hydroperoxide reductase OsmC/OhrA
MAMTLIRLRPSITFSGPRVPDAEELAGIHHAAHDKCYIASSLKAAIVVEG